MKRRIVSAALTNSPAGWTPGLRDRNEDARTSIRSDPPTVDVRQAQSTSERIILLSQQVEKLRLQLRQARGRLRDTQLDSVTALAAAVEAKDPRGQRHSTHVAFYAERLAEPFRLSVRQMEVIKTAAVLHDIGKIAVPDAILTKPGPLTAEEYLVVKQHPVTGATILQTAAWLEPEIPLVLYHHEWYEGGGYPHGLRGEEIPFGARLLHAADAIDAMFSLRCYKASYGVERVCRELRDGGGTQFDPVIADVAATWLESHSDELPCLVAGQEDAAVSLAVPASSRA